MNTTTQNPDLIKVDWVELELGAIVDRYGWESTLKGLSHLLPLGETLSSMIAAIEDQQGNDLCEQSQYTAMSDRTDYMTDRF